MGGDTWFGVPNYGEFVGVYYNEDAFAEAGLAIPTTYEEFVDVLDAFVAQGVTPLAEAGAEYPLGSSGTSSRCSRPTAASSTTTSSTRSPSTGRAPRSRPRPRP